ncbi:MAG TPA: hypothetical protein VFJ16_12135 [Longimicrobium sp.]|nr:hypothetical protein [Longimicrobium sp.]
MAKLKLEIDALRVESFVSVAEDGRGGGTVYGRYLDPSYPAACVAPPDSEPYLNTCGYATCAGDTCWQSCNGYTCGCDAGSGNASYDPTCAGDSCINKCSG